MTTGITSSKRSKTVIVREAIAQLESKIGKMIPIEELEKITQGKFTPVELEDILNLLIKECILFRPKKGYLQKI